MRNLPLSKIREEWALQSGQVWARQSLQIVLPQWSQTIQPSLWAVSMAVLQTLQFS